MAELQLPPDEMPVDPALLPVQLALMQQADKILAFSGTNLSFFGVMVDVDPVELQARLRDTVIFPTLGQIMLVDGDSLSAVPPNDLQQDLDLYVADENLRAVSVRAWGTECPKSRFVSVAGERPRDNYVVFEGETDRERKLTVGLHYGDRPQSARQTLSLTTGTENAGQLPVFFRDVFAPAYADVGNMGYSGHNEKWQSAGSGSEDEALQFVHMVGRLFAERFKD